MTLASCVKKIGGIASGLVDPYIVRVDDGGEIFVPPMVLLRMETFRESRGKDVVKPLDLTIGAGVVGGGLGDVGPEAAADVFVELVTEDRGAVIHDDNVREAVLKKDVFVQKLGRGLGGLFRNRPGDEELGEMVDSRNNV